MGFDCYEKPIYGARAAEVWKEITGNYPILPHTEEAGAVILNPGNKNIHLVGFFGFPSFPDQVLAFDSYFEAESFYRNARDNPRSYRSKKPEFDLLKPVEEKAIEPQSRPRHQFEGSGSVED